MPPESAVPHICFGARVKSKLPPRWTGVVTQANDRRFPSHPIQVEWSNGVIERCAGSEIEVL